jgi:ABC-2 type transport system ATP-binding protein
MSAVLALAQSHAEPETAAAPGARTAPDDLIVRVEGLTKSYGTKLVLDDLSFTVRKGEIFGILGPNGAGKTTTLEILEGLRTADRGRIEVFGLTHGRQSKSILQRMGVALQSTEYWDHLTVLELVRFFRSFYARGPEPAALLQLFDLQSQAALPLKQLSGGQRQRVSIALALVNDPDLILLDEPSIGLDPQARRRMWDKIQELKATGKTIILTTHYMEEAAHLCDRVAIMNKGRIITCDSPAGAVRALDLRLAISFTTSASVDAAALLQEDWCTQAKSLAAGRLVVYVRELRQGLGGLLSWAERNRLPIDDLQCRGATLEDVYLHHLAHPASAEPSSSWGVE